MINIIFLNLTQKPLPPRLDQLQNHYNIQKVDSVHSALELLKRSNAQIFIYYSYDFDELTIAKFNSIRGGLGVIILSPTYNLKNEIRCFRSGADHYLLDSTPIASIVARLDSLIQKKQTPSNMEIKNIISQSALPSQAIAKKYADLNVLFNQNMVQCAGRFIRLTPTEMHLLLYFIDQEGFVVTRKSLKQNIFKNENISTRTIDAHIAKLKKKLPPLKTTLKSIYGKGYLLVNPKIDYPAA